MGRCFFIISAILHGMLLLVLFSWGFPPADPMHPKNIVEVSLVEKIEEMKPQMVLPPIVKEPEKRKRPEKKEILPVPERKIQKEEKREERVEPAPVILKEVRQKDDDRVPPENKELRPQVEQPLLAEVKGNPPRPEMGNYEGRELGSGGNGGTGLKEGTGSTFLASAASGTGTDGVGFGGTGGTPGRTRGEGSPGQTAGIRHSPGGGESDGVLSLILRKLESAKRYPRMARKMGVEGTAVVRFKLDSGGRVETVEIVDSSGSEILDKASLETVHAAAPFPYKEGWLKVGIVFKIF